MARLSPILRTLEGAEVKTLIFKCPGCGYTHSVPVEPNGGKPSWTWNDDPVRPTFRPSLLVRSGHYVPGQPAAADCYMCKRNAATREAGGSVGFECGICHSYVTDGRIEFLSDCTHPLAGQTVDLPEWLQEYGGT